MPLFKSTTPTTDTTVDRRSSESPTRKKSIFSSSRHSPPPPASTTSTSGSGMFGRNRRRSSSSSSSGRSGSGSGGFLGMGGRNRVNDDPSIRGARQKVADAETAEKQADRALIEARNRVNVAREHVQMLEREALEDARRAKAKQAQAKVVSKSAKGLGRHGT